MAYGVVYRITCLVTGKQYHGQTINVAERWAHHLRKDSHCRALRNAFAKYGRENFCFDIVAGASSAEELNALEEKYVASSLTPVGYNLVEGGGSHRPSAETRAKISRTNKVVQNLPEVRARNSAGVKRALACPEVKKRQSAAVRRRFSDPKEREAASLRMKEVHTRPEQQSTRSQAQTAVWAAYSAEERAERREKQKASITSEVRLRMSEQAVERWTDPDYVALQSERRRISHNRPEIKAAKSQRMKEIHARPGEKERRGTAISRVHRSIEGRAKLARRRRRGETLVAWRERVEQLDRELT
jgi:group I intron endonuclease